MVSILGILFVATMFSSCATTYTASGTNVSKIDELAFIEPRSLMYYFSPESGYLDSSLVVGSEELITEIITSNRYPFTDPVAADYEGKGASVANWIDRFSDLESSDIPRLKVPKELTELIKSTGHRYGKGHLFQQCPLQCRPPAEQKKCRQPDEEPPQEV